MKESVLGTINPANYPVADEVIDPRAEPTSASFPNQDNCRLLAKYLSLYPQICVAPFPLLGASLCSRQRPSQKTTGQHGESNQPWVVQPPLLHLQTPT